MNAGSQKVNVTEYFSEKARVSVGEPRYRTAYLIGLCLRARVRVPYESFMFGKSTLSFFALLQLRDHAEILERRGVALHVPAGG
jgi:hypothetical protein